MAPWPLSASGSSEPTGSSGEISPRVIARPNTSEVTDFASDQLSYRVSRLAAYARSTPTRQPLR